MNCKELEILLSAYANDELPASEMETVNAHLSGCSDCRTTLSAFQEVRRQISGLKDISVTLDVKDAAMAEIKKLKTRSPAKRWLFRSLIAVPVVAVLIALQIIQPWVSTPGFQEVMAKSYLAVIALKSYRTEMTVNYSPSVNLPPLINEVAYVAPDRYYTKNSDSTKVEETIVIGEQEYYKTTPEGTVPQFINPDFSGLAPDMGNTFRLLNTLHELKTLPDEVIDGVKCYHYRGILYQMGTKEKYKVDIWVGKDDNLPRKETTGNFYTIRFFDLNRPVTIEPPLTPAGELLQGWHILQTAPQLVISFSISGGGEGLDRSLLKCDITLNNDGLREAKDVHVTIQTPATNNPVKPAILEATPGNGTTPINIASWQSGYFHAEWEFDAGNLSKIELAQLYQKITITATFQDADGTGYTVIYPKIP